MTPESEQLVQQSWPLIAQHGAAMAERFYGRLFEIAPELRRLFADTEMLAQQRKFVTMLEEIVKHLGQPAELVPEVAALGTRHVQYGVSARDYGLVGEALAWAMEQVMGEAMTPDLRLAWNEAYVLTASLMARGAMTRPLATP